MGGENQSNREPFHCIPMENQLNTSSQQRKSYSIETSSYRLPFDYSFFSNNMSNPPNVYTTSSFETNCTKENNIEGKTEENINSSNTNQTEISNDSIKEETNMTITTQQINSTVIHHKPLPARPSQSSVIVNMTVMHPLEDGNNTKLPTPTSPTDIITNNNTNGSYLPNSFTTPTTYEHVTMNPEPISHIYFPAYKSTLINRKPSTPTTSSPQKPLPRTPNSSMKNESSSPSTNNNNNSNNNTNNTNNNNNTNNGSKQNKNKKIFYNTEFLEKCGFSNNSIQQQQLKQLKQDEIQEEKLRQIHNEQEAKLKQTEMEEMALVNRTIQQFSFSEYLTSQPKYSWSDFFAHNKNAFSLIRAMASQWSWGEMTLGLEYYARSKAKAKRDFTEFIVSAKLEDIPMSEVEVWRHYARLTYQVFRDSLEDIPRNTKLELQKIIAYDRTQQAMRPGYFLCVDDFTKSVLLIFRGTKSFSDILTDLHCSSIRYKHGYCHKGILTAAQYFDSNKFIKEVIKRTLEHHSGYKLRLLGHSLGGGTAAILATLWKKEFPDIHCYAFACPPVLSQLLSEESSEFVTSFINGDDFVARLSMTAVHELRKDVQTYPWKEEMLKDIQNSMIGKFASGVKNYTSGLIRAGIGFFSSSKKQENEQINLAIQESKKIEEEEKKIIEKEEEFLQSAIEESKKDVIKVVDSNISLNDYFSSDSNGSSSESNTPRRNSSCSQDDISQLSSQLSSPLPSSVHSINDSELKVTTKKKKKKKQRSQDSPLIINDFENLVVTLCPAGKIYQIRNINGTVYIKTAQQEEFSTIILSDSYKEDHRMINYLCNLDNFVPPSIPVNPNVL
ncbi:hypothetical protein ABK040_005418 [Willaertia magna]